MADLATMLRSGAFSPEQVPPEMLMGAPRRPILPPGSVPPLPPQPRPETSGIALQPQSQGERDELRQDGSSAAMAAQTAALSALPLGAMLRGGHAAINLIPRAVNAAPQVATGAAGLAALTAAPEAAGPPEDPRVTEITNLGREIAKREAELNRLATQNLQSRTARENASAPILQAITSARSRMEKLQGEIDAETSARANSSFDKAHPNWNKAWPLIQWGGPVAAAMITKAGGNVAERLLNRPWNKSVRNADEALAAGNTAEFQRNATRASEFLADEPTSRLGKMLQRGGDFTRESALPTIAGTGVGLEAALFRDQYNLGNAAPGSPERADAERRLGPELWSTAARGIVPGTLGGVLGAHLPNVTAGRRPIPESRDLAKRLRDGTANASPTPLNASATALPPLAGSIGQGRLVENMQAGAPVLEQATPQLQLPAPAASPNQSDLAALLRSRGPANNNRRHHSNYQPRRGGQFSGPPKYDDPVD